MWPTRTLAHLQYLHLGLLAKLETNHINKQQIILATTIWQCKQSITKWCLATKILTNFTTRLIITTRLFYHATRSLKMIKSDGTGRQTLPPWYDPSRMFFCFVRRPRFEKPCFRITPQVILKTFLTYHNLKVFKENPFLGLKI